MCICAFTADEDVQHANLYHGRFLNLVKTFFFLISSLPYYQNVDSIQIDTHPSVLKLDPTNRCIKLGRLKLGRASLF